MRRAAVGRMTERMNRLLRHIVGYAGAGIEKSKCLPLEAHVATFLFVSVLHAAETGDERKLQSALVITAQPPSYKITVRLS